MLTGKPTRWDGVSSHDRLFYDFTTPRETRNNSSTGFNQLFTVNLRSSGLPDFVIPRYQYLKGISYPWREGSKFTVIFKVLKFRYAKNSKRKDNVVFYRRNTVLSATRGRFTRSLIQIAIGFRARGNVLHVRIPTEVEVSFYLFLFIYFFIFFYYFIFSHLHSLLILTSIF